MKLVPTLLLLAFLVSVLCIEYNGKSPVPSGRKETALSYRPIVRGRNWAISSRKALASQAGEKIFLKGGNAVDAAIAGLVTLGVVEPAMSGIGGEAFILIYEPNEGKVYSINGGGIAPKAATIEKYKQMGFENMPMDGPLSSVVPGALDSWLVVLDKFGTMSLKEVLAPAIELAEEGFSASEEFVSMIDANIERIGAFESSKTLYLKHGNYNYQVGEIFKNKDLANLYKELVKTEQSALKKGESRHDALKAVRDRFYRGDIAKEIVKFLQEKGGLFTQEDFSYYYALLEKPIHTNYKGCDIYKSPSANQGLTELLILNILENFNLDEAYSARSIHIHAEAVNLAMADREKFIGDLNFVDAPIDGLLSKDYAKERAKLINEERRLEEYLPGNPWEYQGKPYDYYSIEYFNERGVKRIGTIGKSLDWAGNNIKNDIKDSAKQLASDDSIDTMDLTSYVATADKSGLLVSATPSNFYYFGSALVIGPYGFPINDRASYFWLDERHPNSLQPWKRPRNTITPSLALKDGKPYLAYGTPGGDQQCQALSQILANVVDHDMDIQKSIDAPIWSSKSFPLSYAEHKVEEGVMSIDARIAEDVTKSLINRGWKVSISKSFSNNRACIIRIKDGVIEAAVMSKKESQALAW